MIAETGAYVAYASAWRVIRLMPERAAYRMFDQIADRQWQSRTTSVQRLEANLTRVLPEASQPELRDLSREGMRSYMRYWCDAFRLPGWDPARINTFEIRQEHRLRDAVSTGRGAILALPHMGNWDHAGAYVSANITPIVSVAEQLRPVRLYEAFLAFRAELGMQIHGLGEPGVYDALAAACRSGGVVALLTDRDLSAKGIEVQFFGEATRFPAGPAALAVDTGSALHPVGLHWEGHNVGEVLPEVVPPADGDRMHRITVATQAIATSLEDVVRAHPQDWHMLQRLWLADLDPARLAAVDRAGGA
jgi:phosphatidylinositol dimannoside acyltransferase